MTNTENNNPLSADELSLDEVRERNEYLSSFLLESRIDTLNRALDMRTEYLTVMTENMFHAQNASAIVRHCEAFGVQNIHTVEDLCPFLPTLNIALGTDKWIDVKRHATTADAIKDLRKEGYRIIATTPHHKSCTPETFDVKKGKFVLVFGTEKTGVSEEIMAEADEFLQIPMCGMVDSLNVSASAAILIYMLSQRMRLECDDWHLSDEKRTRTLYDWYRYAVRDSEALLERKYPKK
ncbi:MAG: RNA methyltransferase [Alistipes sp.]|nr:RNA methyltransferase [Alistipes sp.]